MVAIYYLIYNRIGCRYDGTSGIQEGGYNFNEKAQAVFPVLGVDINENEAARYPIGTKWLSNVSNVK
ncbi:MAG: hypothetical protein MUF36_02520 [Bacteroidales bacterium]|jgi:hypothetical protein|nr:hypothetical protein [Bacteroidales bacterium]